MGGDHGNHCIEEEEEEEEEEGTAGRTSRIFVGGLGGNVSGNDLVKIFSSLGTVKAVDIVRTKGRSFAYLDFLPSSPKSLPKLFSTYNGCVWKGGRLRLEKAKEHYLVRLRREWAGDAELASSAWSSSVDAEKDIASSEKLKKVLNSEKPKKVLNSEKPHLRIFFPGLRKVKPLPFSGTGKHKYSFQRVEVPSLPIHFCDCEEHSVPSHIANENHYCDPEAQSGGMNEEELNMMKSVMSKLFEGENGSKAASSGAGLSEEGDDSIKSIDDLLLDENANGEDNLILNINMVTWGNNRMPLLGSWEQDKISANQESRIREFHNSNGEPTQNIHKVQKRKTVPSNKRKLLPSEERDRNEFVSATPKRRGSLHTNSNESETLLEGLPAGPESGVQQSATSLSWSQKSPWRELVGDRGNSPFSISHVLPGNASMNEVQPGSGGLLVPDSTDSENPGIVKDGNSEGQLGQLKELEGFAEPQPAKSNPVVDKSTRGASWLHKSSWTQLVGRTNNTSFSISQILPGITFEKQELPKANSMDVASATDSKHLDLVKEDRSESTADGSKPSRLGIGGSLTAPTSSNMVGLDKEQNFNGLDIGQSTPGKKMQTVGGNNELSAAIPRRNDHSAPKQIFNGDIELGESCPFMRSTASVREWVNTKAALTGSLKKKNKEK